MNRLLRRINRLLTHLPPARALVVGYGLYMLVVWLLLCVPFAHENGPIGPLDNLFIAASAVSTTGLVTVSTPDAYTFFGESVIVLGFQAGGLGYMTIGSFLILATRSSLSPSRVRLGRTVFGLPDSFHLPTFVKRIVVYALVVETVGAVLLYFEFREAGVDGALWSAIFHSVSAFCTAGFSIFSNGLEDFRADVGVNVIISCLSLCGAIGFLVLNDVYEFVVRKKKSFTLTSKIILSATFGMILVGMAGFYFFEPTFASLETGERVLAAWFQSMTSLTTVGFNTHPIGELSAAVVLLCTFLMILGASPSGTGGGLKSTTWSAAFSVLVHSLRKNAHCEKIPAFGRIIPQHRILAAFGAIVLYILFFVVGGFLLLLVESRLSYEDLLFELASALGTVGLSRGITGELSALGKTIIIVTMFVGRTGPVTIGIALLSELSSGKVEVQGETEDVIV